LGRISAKVFISGRRSFLPVIVFDYPFESALVAVIAISIILAIAALWHINMKKKAYHGDT